MADFEYDLNIARPAAEVWDRLNDVPFTPRWEKGLTAISSSPDGPLAVGSRVTKVSKMPAGHLTIVQEVTAMDPAAMTREDTVEGGMMSGTVASWKLTAEGEGTALSCHVTVRAQGLASLGIPVLALGLKRQIGEELQAFKEVLEGAA